MNSAKTSSKGHVEPSILGGAVDTHVHSGPDIVPRVADDIETARMASNAGFAAIVLKNHHESTAARAQIAESVNGLISIFGGLVLNSSACGGFNPDAVRITMKMRGKIVWMPTVSAKNHIRFIHEAKYSEHVGAISAGLEEEGLSPLDEEGRIISSVREILDIIAESDAILATGHLSSHEICALIVEAKLRGVERILVTHPEAPQIEMPVDVQRDVAKLGVYFERCYYSVLAGYPLDRMLEEARSVGFESTIFASDLGQEHNPPPAEGLLDLYYALRAVGMNTIEWRTAIARNPRALLALSNDVGES